MYSEFSIQLDVSFSLGGEVIVTCCRTECSLAHLADSQLILYLTTYVRFVELHLLAPIQIEPYKGKEVSAEHSLQSSEHVCFELEAIGSKAAVEFKASSWFFGQPKAFQAAVFVAINHFFLDTCMRLSMEGLN